jgi:TorA maturation chaperone TorD
MSRAGGLPTGVRQPYRERCCIPDNQRSSEYGWATISPDEGSIMSRSPAEEAQEANRGIAGACSLGWQTLALAFHEPIQQWVEGLLHGTVTADLSEAIWWMGLDRERFAGALDMLEDFVTEQEVRDIQDVLRDLKVEYARVFVGAAGSSEAPPYESAYPEWDAAEAATVRGPATLAVEEFYRQYGVQSPSSLQVLPDHIAIELECMYFLSSQERQAWEKGEVETAKALRRAQLRFVEEHLARWVPDFCGRVQNATKSNLSFALAIILREFLAMETRWAYGQSALRCVASGGDR